MIRYRYEGEIDAIFYYDQSTQWTKPGDVWDTDEEVSDSFVSHINIGKLKILKSSKQKWTFRNKDNNDRYFLFPDSTNSSPPPHMVKSGCKFDITDEWNENYQYWINEGIVSLIKVEVLNYKSKSKYRSIDDPGDYDDRPNQNYELQTNPFSAGREHSLVDLRCGQERHNSGPMSEQTLGDMDAGC